MDKNLLVETIYSIIESQSEMEIGISTIEDNGFVIRTVGHGGEVMYNFFLRVQEILWELE
ncbi:hypothetical protein D3C85_1576780 [compost metagenome]